MIPTQEKLYSKLRDKRQKEFSNFKIWWIFSDKQLEELKEKDKDFLKAFNNKNLINYYWWYTTKQELMKIKERDNKNDKEDKELFKNKDFLISAFWYELWNHERQISMDFDVLEYFWLPYTKENIELKNKVEKDYYNFCIDNDYF